MKNTTKKLLAAVMTALLVAVAFVGVAAAGTITFAYESNSDSMTGVYYLNNGYWAVEDTAVEIPVNATAGSAAQYIDGYYLNMSIQNMTGGSSYLGKTEFNITDLGGTNWKNETNFVDSKILRVAVSGDNVSLPTSSYARVFNVSIPAEVLKATAVDGSTPYVVSVDDIDIANSTKDWKTMTSTDDVSLTEVTDPIDFNLNVLKIPVITNVTFEGYYKIDFGTEQQSILLYNEHVEGKAGQVNTTVAIKNPKVDGVADTLLASSEDTNKFKVSSTSVKPITAAGNKVNLTWVANGTAKYDLSIENFTDASKQNVSVTYTNWNQSLVDNYGATSYDDAAHWSFVTPYNRTYNMGYSSVNTTGGWDTGVVAANLSRNTSSTAIAAAKIWNGTITYTNATDKTGTTNYHNLTQSGNVLKFNGGNFTVYKVNGTESYGQDVRNLVVFTGYKLGDANTDGNTNIVDSSVIGIDILKTHDTPSTTLLKDDERIYADCNSAEGDGDVTVADMRAVNRYLVGLDPWGTS